ncbi:MAG TPA: tetratricopeptide repeat protein [Drouetiella sp.]|jgi:tetratricopeptide (TPR) repeat protein
MDLQKLLRAGICVASVSLSISACTPNATETTTTTNASKAEVTVEQAVWEKLTADGDAAKAKGDLKKAEECYQAAVEEAKKLGETDPTFGKTTANLADFYYAQGDGAQADKLYKQSLAVREKALGLEHADLVQSIVGLARVASAEKNYAEAVAHYERAIDILNKNKLPVSDDVQKEYAKAKENASTSKGSKKEEVGGKEDAATGKGDTTGKDAASGKEAVSGKEAESKKDSASGKEAESKKDSASGKEAESKKDSASGKEAESKKDAASDKK